MIHRYGCKWSYESLKSELDFQYSLAIKFQALLNWKCSSRVFLMSLPVGTTQ